MEKENNTSDVPNKLVTHLPYSSVEEGKVHYARLSAQNNWMEEEMKFEDEQESELLIEITK